MYIVRGNTIEASKQAVDETVERGKQASSWWEVDEKVDVASCSEWQCLWQLSKYHALAGSSHGSSYGNFKFYNC